MSFIVWRQRQWFQMALLVGLFNYRRHTPNLGTYHLSFEADTYDLALGDNIQCFWAFSVASWYPDNNNGYPDLCSISNLRCKNGVGVERRHLWPDCFTSTYTVYSSSGDSWWISELHFSKSVPLSMKTVDLQATKPAQMWLVSTTQTTNTDEYLPSREVWGTN